MRAARSADGRRVIRRNGRIVMAAPTADAHWRWFDMAARPAAAVSSCLARALRSRLLSGSIAVIPLMTGATVARAQTIAPLVPPSIDPDYNRGRNISVTEQEDPSYQALGVRLGSILAYPSFSIVTGATNNVFTNDAVKRSDAFYFFRPAVYVTSDWAVHKVEVVAGADIQRYAHQTLRNQNAYAVTATGRLDIGPDAKVTGAVQYSRSAESPYSTDLAADVSVLSQFTRFNPSLTGVYDAGRFRFTGKVERLRLTFSDVEFANGAIRNQRDRDRSVTRASVQTEYALSPSVAAFAQGTYDITNYDTLRADGQANRDSKSPQMLLGVNFDLAGTMRGTLAAGYTKRFYDAPIYADKGGLVLQARAEIFVSALTTVNVGVQQLIQDSGSSFNGAYRDLRANVGFDHALLRNLIISSDFTAIRQRVLDSPASSNRLLAEFSAKYQSNRFISVQAGVQYGRSRPGAVPLGNVFSELSGQVTLRFRR